MRKTIILLLVLLIGVVGLRPLAAADPLAAVADTTTDITAPDTNFDGAQLLTSFSVWPAFKPSTTAWLQFDVGGNLAIDDATLTLTVAQSHLTAGGSITLALYGSADDGWDEATRTAANAAALPAAPLATAVMSAGVPAISFQSAELAAFVLHQRGSDGRASFAIQAIAQTGHPLFGTVVFGDAENGQPALLDLTEGVPLTVGLRGVAIDRSAGYLAAVLALLAVLAALTLYAPRWRRPWRPTWPPFGRAGRRIATLLLVPTLALTTLFGLFRFSAAAEDCTPALPVALSAVIDGDDIFLNWEAQATTSAYRVYAAPNATAPDPATSDPLAILDGSAIGFAHDDALLTASDWVYVVMAVAACDGSSAASDPFGVRVLPLAAPPDGFTLVTNAFAGAPRASLWLAERAEIDLLLKFDTDSQTFAAFLPPNLGHDFDLFVGDPLFVSTSAGARTAAPLLLSGNLLPVDFQLQTGLFNPLSLPVQRGDLDDGDQLLNELGCTDALHIWDLPSQQFIHFTGSGSLPLPRFFPLFVQPVVNLCPYWPGERERLIYFAQNRAAGQVYLRWFTSQIGADFNVYRRTQGALAWQQIATVGAVPDFNAFSGQVPSSVINALALDLRAPGQTTALTPQQVYDRLIADRTLQLVIGNRHTEVAIALGAGYRDSGVPAHADYEYYVAPVTQTNPFVTPYLRPVCADSEPAALASLNVRAVNPAGVPVGLGVLPTTRSTQGAERYDFDLAQSYREMDGRVYLDWRQMRPQPSGSGAWDCWRDPQLTVAGFTVERNGPTTGHSNVLASGTTPGGVIALAGHGSTAERRFRFEDPLKAVYPAAPAVDLYAPHDYTVCAVDWLGNSARCDVLGGVPVRELDTPRSPTLITPTLNGQHTQIQLTWTYSDVEETSLPVTFHVMRSVTLTAPLASWTALGSTTGSSLLVNKQPGDEKVVYWYAVQARDAAGNWSAISNPQHAAFYPRTAPPFTPGFGSNCTDNVMPITLNGIDPAYRQLALYRAFDAAGPFKLVQRFWVVNGSATLTEQYIPTYSTDIYYRLEALDGYGNVSPQVAFCARRVTATPPAAPLPGLPSSEGGTITFPLGDPALPGALEVTVNRPGPGGLQDDTLIATQGASSGAAGAIEWGEAAELTFRRQDAVTGTPGDASTRSVRRTNNFLDTGRHMTDLGPISVQWVNDVPRIQLTSDCSVEDCTLPSFERPLVAIFRKAQHGNWLQVSSVMEITSPLDEAWWVEDLSGPTPEETYSYSVLAFSRDSLEVLGTWRTAALPPLHAPAIGTIANSFFDVFVTVPDPLSAYAGCTFGGQLPTALGFPRDLQLAGGWMYEVDAYFVPTNGSCPSVNTPLGGELGNVYASGILRAPNANPLLTVGPLLFNDFRLDPASGEATGTLHAEFAAPVAVHSGIIASLDGVAFQDDAIFERMVAGRYTLDLPAHVRLADIMTWEPSHAIEAYLADPDPTNYLFAAQMISTVLIDENLPWTIGGEFIEITPQAIRLDQFAFAGARWFPNLPAFDADNNLGYLLQSFQGGSVVLDDIGLSGQFTSTAPIQYQTSLPAAFDVTIEMVRLTLADSQIVGGAWLTPTVALEAYRDRNVLDYIVAGDSSVPNQTTPFSPPLLRTGARQDPADQRVATRIELLPATGNGLALDQFGALLAPVAVANPAALDWLQYRADLAQPTLYLARASFPDQPGATLQPTGVTASMPAHVAWLPLPLGNGTEYDPGLNLIDLQGQFEFGCFTPNTFNGGLDLYVRRGGVSDALSADVAGQTYGYAGFQAQFGTLDLAFQDNALLIPPANIAFTLTLPYPSRVTLPLTVAHLHADCRAELIAPANTTATHAYWNFEHTILQGTIDPATPGELTIFSRDADVLALDDATGVPVRPQLTTTWYANGDIKQSQLRARDNRFALSGMTYDLTTIILTRYYRTPGNMSSLPFAPTLERDDALGGLPAQILAGGSVTGQALKTCSAFPGTAGATGCGLILFDGNAVVDYFGELERNPTLTPATGQNTQGQSPVAVATANKSTPFAALLQQPVLGWEWATGEQLLNYLMPTKLLSNAEGGAIVGLKHDFKLLPDIDTPLLGQISMPEIAVGDLGFVVSFKQPAGGAPYDDQIGIYTGYAAAQAAIRALAQAAPELDESKWIAVEPQAVEWMRKFGYTVDSPNTPPTNPDLYCKTNARKDKDDPVDLACEVWSGWGTKGFGETYDVVNGKVKALKMEVVKNNVVQYGGTSWRLGDTLKETGVVFGANLGDVLFVQKNGEWQLAKINIGTALEVRQPSSGAPRANQNGSNSKDDLILRADWLSFQYNQDGELLLRGEKIQAGLMGGLSDNAISVALLIGTKEGDERIEGGLRLTNIELGAATLKDVAAVLGAGRYSFKPLIYVGIRGEGKLESATVGGSILVGTFSPASQAVLEVAGFSRPIAKMKNLKGLPKPFLGVYGNLYGSVPIYKGTGFEIGGYIEIEGYYFEAQPVASWGGSLIGAIYAKSPIISGRGQLELNVEQITNGSKPGAGFLPKEFKNKPIANRTCNDASDGCIAFTGNIWLAAGLGVCEPETWTNWDKKWWGDKECWTFGVLGALGYLDAPHSGDPWQLDFILAAEPLFE